MNVSLATLQYLSYSVYGKHIVQKFTNVMYNKQMIRIYLLTQGIIDIEWMAVVHQLLPASNVSNDDVTYYNYNDHLFRNIYDKRYDGPVLERLH